MVAHWPFGRGPCLRQSLVIGHLLRSRQPVLRLGVGEVDGRVMAHAWIEFSGTSIGGSDWFLPLLAHPTSLRSGDTPSVAYHCPAGDTQRRPERTGTPRRAT